VDSSARRSTRLPGCWAPPISPARLWERQGDLERALTATRRRVYITDINEQRVLVALSTLLRAKRLLAAKTGDRDGAIRAYRNYLTLRRDAEAGAAEVAGCVRRSTRSSAARARTSRFPSASPHETFEGGRRTFRILFLSELP
jgi:hypothetical protein